jgi:hypothetical protein
VPLRLVGSEMCIRDRLASAIDVRGEDPNKTPTRRKPCGRNLSD